MKKNIENYIKQVSMIWIILKQKDELQKQSMIYISEVRHL